MPQDFGGNSTFNVIGMEALNLRTNSLQEGEDDEYMDGEIPAIKRKYNTIWPLSRTKEKTKKAILCTISLAVFISEVKLNVVADALSKRYALIFMLETNCLVLNALRNCMKVMLTLVRLLHVCLFDQWWLF
ncbi:hypothetical protein CR513_03921, partial [Mucuna pruriens]